MTEKQLIEKIRQLRQIKPKEDWVFLTKSQILGEEMEISPNPRFSFFSFFRPLYAGIFSFLLLAGLTVFSQNALPGNPLYSLKRITEKARIVFAPKGEQLKIQLELANKRLGEINRVAKENKMKRLAPALKEYEITKNAAKKEVAEYIRNKPEKEAIKVAKASAKQLGIINKKQTRTFASLDITPKEVAPQKSNQEDNKIIVEYLIKGAQSSILTDQQKTDLEDVKKYYKMKEYEKALETYLTSSLNSAE